MHRPLLVLLACLALLLCASPTVRGGPPPSRSRPPVPAAAPAPATAAGPSPAAPAREGRPRTYAYGPLPRQSLIVYGARTPGLSRTGVLVVHGGFWYQGGAAGWDAWSRRLAGSGLAVFNLDYRRNSDAPWPAQRNDVLRALRWVAAHARGFGVDPQRLVLLGSSAGGQLAANAAAFGSGKRRVAGLVALSPVADPYRSWRTSRPHDGDHAGLRLLRASAARLAGCVPRECRRTWRDMSAATHASGRDDPPMLLIHSRGDFVPATHSESLRTAELRRGMSPADVTLTTVPGTAHGGALLHVPGVERQLLAWITSHANTRPYGTGPPRVG